jgi:hypothetical protein
MKHGPNPQQPPQIRNDLSNIQEFTERSIRVIALSTQVDDEIRNLT